ncbi:MAG: hypothetical protein K8W52_43645 [Deltaproteobacteria bacterium]|nr:hypothetical protein [Deltaproteobacteria bacterium]
MDEPTRARFFKYLQEAYARVLVEARWVAFVLGGRRAEEAQLTARARELAHEAVDQVLSGRRTWKQDVKFVTFMKVTMRSIAWNEWKLASRHDSVDAEVENDDGSRVPKRQLAGGADPLQLALDEEDAQARVYELFEAAEGDELLTAVISAYLEGDCERPRHVAARLKIPEKDVYQAQRKLERRVNANRKKVTA